MSSPHHFLAFVLYWTLLVYEAMAFNAEIVAKETKNYVTYAHVVKWKLNNISRMKSPGYHTHTFSPFHSPDTRFRLEVWYQIEYEESNIKVALRKMSSAPLAYPTDFQCQVNIYYSDDSLYKSYKSLQEPISAEGFAKLCFEDCSLLSHPITVVAGSPPTADTPHGLKMKSDTLILHCLMKFSSKLPPSEMYHEKFSSLNTLTKLTTNIDGLFRTKAQSDVVIRVGKDEFILAHKCILAAHSSVLNEMVEQAFKDKHDTITIPVFDPKVIESFLKFLYSGEIKDKSIYSVRQHYMMAVKYDVPILKQECVRILCESYLTVDAVCGVLKLVIDFQDSELERRAVMYASDHFGEIEVTDAWVELITAFPEFCQGIVASARIPFRHSAEERMRNLQINRN